MFLHTNIVTFQNNVTNLTPMHPPYHYYEFSIKSFILNGKLNGYSVVYYFYRVSEVEYKIPAIFKFLLKKLMRKPITGKQLIVFLKKL